MEGFRTRAAKLAAAARALNLVSGRAAPFHLAFVTDEAGPDPLLVARALPEGAAVILRHYGDPRRAARARLLRAVTQARGIVLLVGGDAALAAAVDADGVHWRSDQLAAARNWPRGLRLVSAACHDARELARAGALGADIALVSPAFATESHPGDACLGAENFKALAALSPVPVLALGGINENNAARLAGPNVAGIAAIRAFQSR